ncbi:MAG: PEGA domain-containing protein [Myxococcota bacterium]
MRRQDPRGLVIVGIGLSAVLGLTSPAWGQPAEAPSSGGPEKAAPDSAEPLPKAPELPFTVRVSETGARILIDGKPVGTSPLAAPLKLAPGPHKLVVEKNGFVSVEQDVVVGADSTEATVQLKPLVATAPVEIVVTGGEGLKVFVDDQPVGTAPFSGKLTPGKHRVRAEGPGTKTKEIEIELSADATEVERIELVAKKIGRLQVRVEGESGTIFIDGKEVGQGRFDGELSAEEHTLVVEREGYERIEKTITLAPGENKAETVTLRKTTGGDMGEAADEDPIEGDFNGWYGGFHFMADFMPSGSGSTPEQDDCARVLGATSCDGGAPIGGSLAGYFGYAFKPVGLELFLVGGGGAGSSTVNYDGTTRSDVNPLVAQPARDEDFTFARYGGGGAVRIRLLFPVDRFRFGGALGAGMVYRQMVMVRDTTSVTGLENGVTSDAEGYVSAALSADVNAMVLLGGSTHLALGLNIWLETPGDDFETQAETDQVLAADGQIPVPIATPAYDLATGTQFFIGPYLGLHFGP